VDGVAYLIGGAGYAPDFSDFGPVERYDPFVETWSSPTRLQTPRYLSAVSVGLRIFTIGGARHASGGVALNAVEILDTGRL
jgi:hypothetical protein